MKFIEPLSQMQSKLWTFNKDTTSKLIDSVTLSYAHTMQFK